MTPKEAIDSVLDKAPATLKEDKYHNPILFVFGEKANAMVLLEFKDSDSKHKAMLAAGKKVAHLRPYCVAFISEAWMAKEIPPEGKEVHDMPDKEECLVVVAQNRQGETQSAAIPFSRVAGEIVLGETIYAPYTEAYLLKLFWKGTKKGGE